MGKGKNIGLVCTLLYDAMRFCELVLFMTDEDEITAILEKVRHRLYRKNVFRISEHFNNSD